MLCVIQRIPNLGLFYTQTFGILKINFFNMKECYAIKNYGGKSHSREGSRNISLILYVMYIFERHWLRFHLFGCFKIV